VGVLGLHVPGAGSRSWGHRCVGAGPRWRHRPLEPGADADDGPPGPPRLLGERGQQGRRDL